MPGCCLPARHGRRRHHRAPRRRCKALRSARAGTLGLHRALELARTLLTSVKAAADHRGRRAGRPIIGCVPGCGADHGRIHPRAAHRLLLDGDRAAQRDLWIRIEGCIEGVTGWGVASSGAAGAAGAADAEALYARLEHTVLPLYDPRAPAGWIRVMKGAIRRNAAFFNSHRMMRRYATEAYIR